MYETGKKTMDAYEKLMDRDAAIEKWFVTLCPKNAKKHWIWNFHPRKSPMG
ncbi:hypothetical protein FHS14_002209 [Paenibacillus baekrokdamisoli]|nr:hypothetical protein [Paenibacillus baekrokdamisoli]